MVWTQGKEFKDRRCIRPGLEEESKGNRLKKGKRLLSRGDGVLRRVKGELGIGVIVCWVGKTSCKCASHWSGKQS